MRNKIIFSVFLCSLFACSEILAKDNIKIQTTYKKSLVNYDDFKELVSEVESHRKNHLLSFDNFLKMSKETNVVILDARSNFRFQRKHIKGAINLSFTDFTQKNISNLIPDKNTRILIYCNNNFSGDQVDFETKMSIPPSLTSSNQILSEQKPIMLALNIPTYINLYGYGYKNIYELDELVNINDTRISFEGTEVKKL
jgi:hypothetical protein